jgi:hypothetical protein
VKVAICFYGLIGGRADKSGKGVPLDPTIAYELNKKNLLENDDIDVFIHSWSHEFKDKLIELYQPKLSLIEPQIQFPQSKVISQNRDLSEKLSAVSQAIKGKKTLKTYREESQKEAFRAYSRWYSNKSVLELKSQYEKDNGFEYDCVMVLRLDVGFYTSLDFNEYDMENFHASHWNDYPVKSNDFTWNKKNHNTDKGFLDFWFFSNSKNMDRFGELYSKIENYHVCPHRSAYQHVKTFTNKIEYTKYRWIDFEMIRRKEFESEI